MSNDVLMRVYVGNRRSSIKVGIPCLGIGKQPALSHATISAAVDPRNKAQATLPMPWVPGP